MAQLDNPRFCLVETVETGPNQLSRELESDGLQ